MLKLFFIPLFFIGLVSFSQKTYVPDDNFEQALIDLGYDSGPLDDYVLTSNINNITDLNLEIFEIISYEGIKGFIALESLSLSLGDVTSLDLTSNINLTSLDLSGGLFESIDLTKNTELEVFTLITTGVTNLNLNNNLKLKEIAIGTNSITELDLSLNKKLERVEITHGMIENINLKNGTNTSIAYFSAEGQFDLQCVRVDDVNYSLSNWLNIEDSSVFSETCGGFQQLTYVPDDNFEQALIDLGYDSGPLDDYVPTENINTIKQLNINSLNIIEVTGIQDFIALEIFECVNNKITSLNLEKNTELTFLKCSFNEISQLDLSFNPLLTTLNTYQNKLTSLNITNNSLLTDLECGKNQLMDLNLFNNSLLTNLNCWYNQLTSLDISQNSLLIKLECSYNQLISLDTSNNSQLTRLSCFDNQLTSLNVTKSILLDYLECSNNQLSGLDVTKNTLLTRLSCFNNQLTSLNVTNCILLDYLSCGTNQLTSLNVTKNTLLTEFSCHGNYISSLDVTKNLILFRLDCSLNFLTALDVSQNSFLNYLTCSNNQITSLDLTNNNKLYSLYSIKNHLDFLDIRSGNNTDLEQFYSTDNPNLSCIYVDNATYSASNWLYVDSISTFVETEIECAALDCAVLPEVDELNDVSNCDEFILPSLSNGNYYNESGGLGTLLNQGDIINSTQTIYIYNVDSSDSSCYNESSFEVVISPPEVDKLDDISSCDEFILPSLNNGNYYTQSGGLGTQLNVGNIINSSQTIYIYNEDSTDSSCFNESSFDVTISSPEVDELDDVSICEEFILPSLNSGNYFTQSGGLGTQLNIGDIINSSQTIYIYNEASTDPSCFNESSFDVFIEQNNDFNLTDSNILIDEKNITINMDDLTIDYEYSLDNNTNYQSNNNFINLSEGEHTLYVQSINGCVEKNILFTILNNTYSVPLFFTPNNDTINDYWKVDDFNNLIQDVKIFNRFGKFITILYPNSEGWNGYYQGEKAVSTNYWYLITLKSGESDKGSFFLKR